LVEIDLNNIKNELEKEYDIKLEVKENKLCCEEFNGYIKNDDTYLEVENLAENICYWIEGNYNYFTNYFILDSGYIFIIEIF